MPASDRFCTCNCCRGVAARTPMEVFNRPGLSAIDYRVGTHASFKASMLAGLSSSDRAALQGLRSRADADFSIGLIDAWATVLDILTFYQERVANESYLPTAVERRSLIEQARLIGYRPRPGVAASTFLAFTVEDPGMATVPGGPPPPTPLGWREVQVPIGTTVQSVPLPGEAAQTYETIEPLSAHVEWNSLRPRLSQPHPIQGDLEQVLVPGLSPFVKAGDWLLIAAGSQPDEWTVKQVRRVVANAEASTSALELTDAPTPVPWVRRALPLTRFQVWRRPVLSNDVVARLMVHGRRWNQRVLRSMARTYRWSPVALQARINLSPPKPSPTDPGVFAFRERAALFGHSAPKWASLPDDQRKDGAVYHSSWEGRTLFDEQSDSDHAYIDLDRTYPGAVPGGWVVLASPTSGLTPQVYRIEEAGEHTRADFTITAKVTRLRVHTNTHFDRMMLRDTSVLLTSERMDLAPLPIVDPVEGSDITVNGAYLGLEAGRWVAVTGERQDLSGVQASEVVRLAEVSLDEGWTTLTFQSALAHPYVRRTVRICANVAAATHGETRREWLGSGDGSLTFQRFTLRQPPLTYVSAPTASGGRSTLEVRVNDQRWQEVDSLYGKGPTDRVYVTRTDDEGKTTVQFGDGSTGARLPTGQQNVRARYRQGLGAAGLVKAGQLTLLLSKPAGVRDVTNPLDATGAADPESVAEMRRHAALPLRTLGRIVSLQDYEDFAAAFSGISQALATVTWIGGRRGILLTVAGVNGEIVEESSALYGHLVEAIHQAGDPLVPVHVVTYRPALFKLAGTLVVAEDADAEIVLEAVRERLRQAFAFSARRFGQSVGLAEIMAVMHEVPGVEAVHITEVHRVDEEEAPARQTELLASAPQSDAEGTQVGAELLMLDEGSLTDIGVQS